MVKSLKSFAVVHWEMFQNCRTICPKSFWLQWWISLQTLWTTEPLQDALFIPTHDTVTCYRWTCGMFQGVHIYDHYCVEIAFSPFSLQSHSDSRCLYGLPNECHAVRTMVSEERLCILLCIEHRVSQKSLLFLSEQSLNEVHLITCSQNVSALTEFLWSPSSAAPNSSGLLCSANDYQHRYEWLPVLRKVLKCFYF